MVDGQHGVVIVIVLVHVDQVDKPDHVPAQTQDPLMVEILVQDILMKHFCVTLRAVQVIDNILVKKYPFCTNKYEQ